MPGGPDRGDLVTKAQGLVLGLNEEGVEPQAPLQLTAGSGVEVGGPKLGERLEIAELRHIEAELASDRPHRLALGGTPDAADRDAGVHGGALAGIEEVRLQEDLAVGDGDDVRGNVGGDVARLGFDDRQSGH